MMIKCQHFCADTNAPKRRPSLSGVSGVTIAHDTYIHIYLRDLTFFLQNFLKAVVTFSNSKWCAKLTIKTPLKYNLHFHIFSSQI